MVCAAGLAGGHGSTVLSPLNLPSAPSTYESTRFETFDSVLAVKFGSLYAPVGKLPCVRGSNPSNGNGLSGCCAASQLPIQPPGLRRPCSINGLTEKLKGVCSAL